MFQNKEHKILQAANILYIFKPFGDIVLLGQIRKEFIPKERKYIYVMDFDDKAVDKVCERVKEKRFILIPGVSLDAWNYREKENIPNFLHNRYWDRRNTIGVEIFAQIIDMTKPYDEFSFCIRNRGLCTDNIRFQELIVTDYKITHIAPIVERNFDLYWRGKKLNVSEVDEEFEAVDYWREEYNSKDWQRLKIPDGAKKFYKFHEKEKAYKFIPKY